MRFFVLLLSFWLLALFLSACGDLPDGSSTKTVASITLHPSSATLEVGHTQLFSAEATYTDGTSGSIKPTWSVEGGIGTITTVGYNGYFTGTGEATGTVVATYSGKTGSAVVVVNAATGESLSSITISPVTTTSRVTGSIVFTATGKNGSGESMTIDPSWQISNGGVGNFSYSGTVATLEVTGEGYAVVSCISGEVTGYSYVTIEGFVTEITVEVNTYVDEGNPATAHGGETSLKAGYYVETTGKHYETYLQFAFSAIPASATIESVTLKIYPTTAPGVSFSFKQLTSAFTVSSTWATKPATGSFIVSKSFTVGQYNSVTADGLTTLVQNWHSGATTNYGLAVMQEATDAGTVVFLSKENIDNPPVLQIEYTRN